MPAKKQITKDMIVSAAMDMLRARGMDAVNVKALAKKLNCSTQPIYLSFDGMDALRAEIAALAVEIFFQRMSRDGAAELFGMSYIQFAGEEKQLFRFLFMRQDAFLELRAALAPIMDAAIDRLMERYHIDREEAHHLHDQLWVHAHGIASMIATGFCDWNMDKVQKMLAECEHYFCRKYEVRHVQ